MTHVRDAVDGDGIGRLVLLDPDAAGAEVVDGGPDVRDAPGDLGLGVGGADRAQRDRDCVPPPQRKTIRSPSSSRRISSPSVSR